MPNFDDSMWKYGLHLCRRNGNPNLFEDDTVGMQAAFLPVDSDCVDEMIMPTSFDIQTTYNLREHVKQIYIIRITMVPSVVYLKSSR